MAIFILPVAKNELPLAKFELLVAIFILELYLYILIVTILNAKMLAGIIFIILTIGIFAPIIIAIVAYIVAIIDNATKDER